MISNECSSDASVIWGVAFDPNLEDEMRITIIAADFQPEEEAPVALEEAPAAEEPVAAKAEEDDFFAGMF
jgi:cell division GTPase FtsZ